MALLIISSMPESSSKKAAPQRGVIEIVRTGEWSKVQYIHRLECGHTEVRKRAAATSKIACLSCVKANTGQKMLESLSRPVILSPPVEVDMLWDDDLGEEVLETEHQVSLTRSAVAGHVGVGPDSVDVVVEEVDGNLEISYVVVFIDSATAKRIVSGARPR